MTEEVLQFLIIALILFPLLGALLCGMMRRTSGAAVLSLSLVEAGMAILLLAIMLKEEMTVVALGEEGWEIPGLLIVILDLALAAYFVVVGLKKRQWWVVLFALVTIILSVAMELQIEEGEGVPILVVDHLSLLFVLITSIVGGVICVFAVPYMKGDGGQARFFLFMFLFLGAMNAAVMCNDLLWLFFFWEVTTLCSFMLIGHDKTEEAERAAFRALKYTLGGAVCFSLALVFLQQEGGLSATELLARNEETSLLIVSLGLMVIAALTKSAQVPFQRWLVGAMVAPTPVSALLHSATMVNLGIYLLLRFHEPIGSIEQIPLILGVVGAFSFLATSILALRQSSSKRVLAYSTIGNLGLMVVCIAIGGDVGLMAAMVLLLFHAVSKALLFLSVGVVKHETGSEDIENMVELRDRSPWIAYALLLGVFLLLLPGFGTFVGKWALTEMTIEMPVLAFILAIGLGASVVYYGKWVGRLFTDRRGAQPAAFTKIDPWFNLPLLVLIGLGMGLSLLVLPLVQYLFLPYIDPSSFDIDTFWDLDIVSGVMPVALIFLIMIVAIWFVVRVKPSTDEYSPPYTGGEPMEFTLAGDYLYDERIESKALQIFEMVGAVLLVLLLAVPLFDFIFVRGFT